MRKDPVKASDQGEEVHNADPSTESSEPIGPPMNGQSHPGVSPNLPIFNCLPKPAFVWGEVDVSIFTTLIHEAYKEIVHWRRNQFKVPQAELVKHMSWRWLASSWPMQWLERLKP